MADSDVRFRVRYAETDQMGVVYHANYLMWMEMGRVELCRSMGIRYRDMEEKEGILLVVASATCRFISPARYDDEVLLRTTIARSSTRLVEFQYEIRMAEEDRLLTTGSTTHIFCTRDLKPTQLPQQFWKAFGVNKRVPEPA